MQSSDLCVQKFYDYEYHYCNYYLRPMQTDATLLANNTQHCWAQHVASVCMEPQQCWQLLALVAYSLKPVKLLGPCKRTQHCWPKPPNSMLQCCDLLRPFAWAFTVAHKCNAKLQMSQYKKINVNTKKIIPVKKYLFQNKIICFSTKKYMSIQKVMLSLTTGKTKQATIHLWKRRGNQSHSSSFILLKCPVEILHKECHTQELRKVSWKF